MTSPARAIALLLGALILAAAGLAACSARPAADTRPPNLLLVTIDTLRADHLGVYGYPRDTSPNLDALAREGTWFASCYSQSATTGAGHAALFTSLPPIENGVTANRQRFPDLPSIMSALRGRGYFAAAFVSSIVVGRQSGLQDHFDHFDDQLTGVEPTRKQRSERPAADTIAAVRAILDQLPAGRPFFLWIHLIDPHGPYQAPEDPDRYVGDATYDRVRRELPLGASDWVIDQIPRYQILAGRRDADFYIARYDAEIRYADAHLGRLLDDLRGRGLLDRTLVAVTADHGETLVEPGHHRYFSHGAIAYEETVRIPLIVREPGGRAQLAAVRRDRPVSSLDVAPTLLALLGVERPPTFRGRNLLVEVLVPGAPMLSFGAFGTFGLEKDIGTQFGVRRGPWRFLVNSTDGSEELYDHRTDPGEARNVAAEAPPELASLRAEVNAALANRPPLEHPAQIPAERAEGLRALGYVE